MAWDEWEELKADAVRNQSARMQLNRVPDEGGGGSTTGPQGDLTVDQQELAAMGDSAFKLYDRLGRSGRDAWSGSQTAAADLRAQGFELGGGLDHVQKRWEEQLRSLLDACGHISNHMDFTKNAHRGDEYYVAGIVSSIAQLDDGFDEGSTG